MPRAADLAPLRGGAVWRSALQIRCSLWDRGGAARVRSSGPVSSEERAFCPPAWPSEYVRL